MKLPMELRKTRRTGFFPAFLAGGLLASAFPLANTALRPERLGALSGPPLAWLLAENWGVMAMVHLLLLLAGTCTLYHTEHAGSMLERTRGLPIRENRLFFGKAAVTAAAFLPVLGMEAACLFFCCRHWLAPGALPWPELLGCFGFAFLLSLPALLLALLTASLFQNMWTALGLGVIGVFLASMLPERPFVLSLFPYALPFRTLPGCGGDAWKLLIAAAVESAGITGAELVWIKSRRWFT